MDNVNITEKFEYHFCNYSGKNTREIFNELNKMGSEGWELINLPELTESGINANLPLFVFKRNVIECVTQLKSKKE